MPRWIPCTATITIEGRGPVRCWQPPRPGGRGLCAAHEKLLDPQPLSQAPGVDALRACVLSVLHDVTPDARLVEFQELPGDQYELRLEAPDDIGKLLHLPRRFLQRATFTASARHSLRAILETAIRLQRAQAELNASREHLALT